MVKSDRAWHYRDEIMALDEADPAAAAAAAGGGKSRRQQLLKMAAPIMHLMRLCVYFQCTTAEQERLCDAWDDLVREFPRDSDLVQHGTGMDIRLVMWVPIDCEPGVPERLEEPRPRRRRRAG